MTRAYPVFRILMVAVLVCAASPAAAQVNVTGTWRPKYWTVDLALHQEGNDVRGSGGRQDFKIEVAGHTDATGDAKTDDRIRAFGR